MKYSFVPFREENFERIDLSIRNYVYRALSSSSFRSTSQYVRTKFQLRYFSQTYGTLPRSVSLSSTRFPYRQGKLCYHTCYRSTLERYWRKKSVSARNARRGKAAFPSFLRPRQTGDDEFIENRLVLSRATVFFFFSSRPKRNWIHKSTMNRYDRAFKRLFRRWQALKNKRASLIPDFFRERLAFTARSSSFPTMVTNANCALINRNYGLFKIPAAFHIAFSLDTRSL